MRHTLFISAAVLLALSSCTTYTAPTYVEPANPVDTTGIDPNKAKSPSFLVINPGGEVPFAGNPNEQKVILAKKTMVGNDVKLELRMSFLMINVAPYAITMNIPDYKGAGTYGKEQKFEYANVNMNIISQMPPQITYQGDAGDITVTVVNDNAKYIEINFAGTFDVYLPNGTTSTTDLNGTWLVRWEL